MTKSIERRQERGQPVTVGSLPTMFVRVSSARKPTPGGGTAGVIGFNVWMTAVNPPFEKAMDEFRSADGVVIDLRGNPGGLAGMIMGIAGHFMTERATLGVMKTQGIGDEVPRESAARRTPPASASSRTRVPSLFSWTG